MTWGVQKGIAALGKPFRQNAFQFIRLDGLGQVVPEAQGEIALTGACDGICGQRDHGRGVVNQGFIMKLLQGFDPVKIRHHMVHQHDIIVLLPDHLDGFLSAGGKVGNHMQLFQQAFGHLKVHGVIIHYKDICLFDPKLLLYFLLGIRSVVSLISADRRSVDHLLTDTESKGRAFPVFAGHFQTAVHQLQDTVYDGEPEAGSLYGPVPPFIQALEGEEELLAVFLPDPDTGVFYFHIECTLFGRHGFAPHGQGNASLLRIFYGVGQQVRDDLTDPDIVSVQGLRKPGVYIQLQLQVLLLSPVMDQVHQIIDHSDGFIFYGKDLHLAALDLREVQDPIDQGQESTARILDIHGIFADRRILAFPEDHFIHTDHGIDGGTDLMTHLSQEVGFRLTGRGGFFDGFLQLPVHFRLGTDNLIDQDDDRDDDRKDRKAVGSGIEQLIQEDAGPFPDKDHGEARILVRCDHGTPADPVVVREGTQFIFLIRIGGVVGRILHIYFPVNGHLILGIRVVDDISVGIHQEDILVLRIGLTEDVDDLVHVKIDTEDSQVFPVLTVYDTGNGDTVISGLLIVVGGGNAVALGGFLRLLVPVTFLYLPVRIRHPPVVHDNGMLIVGVGEVTYGNAGIVLRHAVHPPDRGFIIIHQIRAGGDHIREHAQGIHLDLLPFLELGGIVLLACGHLLFALGDTCTVIEDGAGDHDRQKEEYDDVPEHPDGPGL